METTTPMVTSTPVSDLRKGGHVMLQGHPCKIVDMTVTKMMAETSGRAQYLHPNIWCNACDTHLPETQARYACLDCPDYDLCERCEGTPGVVSNHADGNHVFAKIRNSRTVTVQRYRQAYQALSLNDM